MHNGCFIQVADICADDACAAMRKLLREAELVDGTWSLETAHQVLQEGGHIFHGVADFGKKGFMTTIRHALTGMKVGVLLLHAVLV